MPIGDVCDLSEKDQLNGYSIEDYSHFLKKEKKSRGGKYFKFFLQVLLLDGKSSA